MLMAAGRECRVCGCDDNHACEGGCAWVLLDIHEPTGVCSACAEELGWHPVILARLYLGESWQQSAEEYLRQSAEEEAA